MKNYLAIDIGAESGRLILGSVSNETLEMKEIHRFQNGMLCIQGHYYWNIGQIYKEILTGFEKCVQGIIPESVGIDTWGVDYGLLTSDGTLLGMPYTYRDPRTEHAIEELTSLLPASELYKLTGTQLAPYNTIFQLFAAKKSHPELLLSASDLLFMPDLITWFLTGEKKTERSFASTSQLYNPNKKQWEEKLFQLLGISKNLMQEVSEPETIIGYLSDDICKQTGLRKIPIVAVATHDTNSAVTAIPAKGNNWAFISTGTWSLMGFESKSPVINDQSFQMNFTNEGGIRGSYHILKNIMGFWPLQECRRSWKNENYSYSQLVDIAREAQPFEMFIDIDYPGFLNPTDMPLAINEYLKKTKQNLPKSHGQYVRVILESLVMKYRQTLEQIEILKGSSVEELYITGGGIQNELLCQFTADAIGRPIYTGLAEGTAAGNLLTQALALGQFATIDQIRDVIRNSCNSKTFQPINHADWNKAYQQYNYTTKK